MSADEYSRFVALPTTVRSSRRLEAFRNLAVWSTENVDLYRDLLDAKPKEVSSWQDWTELPTSEIGDLRASIETNEPYGRHWVRDFISQTRMILTTGGTTGVPRPVPISQADIDEAGTIAERTLRFVGVTPKDRLHVTATYSTHGAAWIATWGASKLGCSVIPASGGATTSSLRQLELMRRFQPTVLFTTATYLKILASLAEERDLPQVGDLDIRRIVIAGEVVTPETRRHLEDIWRAKIYDLYGTMETLVWSSVECEASREAFGELGMHIWDDVVHLEVLDAAGQVCQDGEYGDLTLTTGLPALGPKIRYRMGDRVAITREKCPCGFDSPRMLPVRGRVDDMIRIHGQNVWPNSVDDVLRRACGYFGEYVAIVEEKQGRDTFRVCVEADADSKEAVASMQQRLRDEFKSGLAIGVTVDVISPGETAKLSGAGKAYKSRRIIDRRNTAMVSDSTSNGPKE